MEHSLRASASVSGKRLFMHLRGAVAVAVTLGAVGVSATSASAADPTPLTGQITPALSTISAPTPVAGRYIVTFSPGASNSDQSTALADAGAVD
jgi:pectin methylesterase-like acyl-CoA thioesterase